MTGAGVWVVACIGALALLALAGAGLLIAVRARREVTEMRTRLDGLNRNMTAEVLPAKLRIPRSTGETDVGTDGPAGEGGPGGAGYVITDVGQEGAETQQPVPMVEGRLFADLVLRESVVRAAALAHGVRRALAPATRNRIRFEMRTEVKRARRQRRADVRTAVREWEARQRARDDAAASGEDAA